MVEVGRTWVILAFYLMTSSTLGHPLIGMKQNHRWRPFNLIEEPAGGGRSLSPNVGLSYGGLTFKDLANTYQDEPVIVFGVGFRNLGSLITDQKLLDL